MAHIIMYKNPVLIKAVCHGAEHQLQLSIAWMFIIVLIVHTIKIVPNPIKSNFLFIFFWKINFKIDIDEFDKDCFIFFKIKIIKQ
jgi:hypothetical protein